MKVIDRYNQRRKLLVKKKSLERFLPDFFDMDKEQRLKHIFEQKSVDYLLNLMKTLDEGENDKVYYESHIYRRIYDIILK